MKQLKLFNTALIVLSIVLINTLAFAQSQDDNTAEKSYPVYNSISFSPTLSIKSGAETVIGVNHALAIADEKLIGTKWFLEETAFRKMGGVFGRFVKYYFLDMPITYFSGVVAHEYWGHGSRYRELDVDGVDYGYDPPPPYGDGGGHASVSIEGNTITDHEVAVIIMGGFEVQAEINRQLNLRYVSTRNIHYREAILYFENFKIFFDYLQDTPADLNPETNNKDAAVYIRLLNNYAGYTDYNNPLLDLKYLKDRYYVNMANPFLAYSIYSTFKSYLWGGETYTSVPMIHFDKFDYLPSLKAGLTPFGLQYHLENYFRIDNRTGLIDLRVGDSKLYESWGGIGLLIQDVYRNKQYALDVDINLWKQPAMMIGREDASLTKEGIGASLSCRGHYDFSDTQFPVSMFVELGYKSAGFVEGHDLDAAPIFMFGLGYRN